VSPAGSQIITGQQYRQAVHHGHTHDGARSRWSRGAGSRLTPHESGWSEAKAIADSILAESPDVIDRLGCVAVLAARLGERAAAEQQDPLAARSPKCYTQ